MIANTITLGATSYTLEFSTGHDEGDYKPYNLIVFQGNYHETWFDFVVDVEPLVKLLKLAGFKVRLSGGRRYGWRVLFQ